MPPTRVLRTDIVYNVIDFGAISDGAAGTDNLAAFNACAAAVVALGGGRILVPPSGPAGGAGFLIDGSFVLPANCWLVGVGARSIIHGRPGSGAAAIQFAEGVHRGGIEGILVRGNEGAPAGIGISMSRAQFCTMRDFSIWYYETGLQFSEGTTSPPSYCGYAHARDFEISECHVGVEARENTNSCSLKSGRVYFAVGGDGVGVDIDSCDVFSVNDINIEPATVGVRVRGLVRVALRSLYIETADAFQDAWDVDIDSDSILRVENVFPSVLGSQSIEAGVEEAVVWDGIDSYAFGARRHYAASAAQNLVENGDVHAANGVVLIPQWFGIGAPMVAENTTDFVTGGRSYDVTQSTSANDGLAVQFEIPDGAEYVTAMFRWMHLTAGRPALRVQHGSEAGLYVERRDPDDSRWRVTAVTTRVDPTAGPTASASIGADSDATGGAIRIDSIWAVNGRCAGAERQHGHRIEMLTAPVQSIVDRNNITADETFAAVNLTALTGLARPPRGAIGALLRLRGLTVGTDGPGLLLTSQIARPFIDVPGTPHAELPLTVDRVTLDRVVILRGMTLNGGVASSTGAFPSTSYDIDLLGWLLPS